jgi:hypothetical protein
MLCVSGGNKPKAIKKIFLICERTKKPIVWEYQKLN